MKTIKVGIVEDIDEIRDSLRLIINGTEGFECIHSFPEALSAIEDVPESDLDVLLLDVNLPKMSGIDAAKILKEKCPDLEIMMCTVHDDDSSVFAALKNGASGYILKKTPPAQIIESIREIHEGGSPMSSEIARRVVDSIRIKPEDDLEILTLREKAILDRLERGLMYKEISDELKISIDTVKKHIHHIYSKLHVQNRTEAVRKLYGRR
ncbi:MAG TPA: response regulator transcription factor [Chitinophagales bacterium]|nr:response regulator transcription factor [Chitinophagales bacterium]